MNKQQVKSKLRILLEDLERPSIQYLRSLIELRYKLAMNSIDDHGKRLSLCKNEEDLITFWETVKIEKERASIYNTVLSMLTAKELEAEIEALDLQIIKEQEEQEDEY